VKIQVRDIGTIVTWTREPNLRIEIRAVDIHLSAGSMHQFAQFAYPFLEDAMGRR